MTDDITTQLQTMVPASWEVTPRGTSMELAISLSWYGDHPTHSKDLPLLLPVG